MEWTSKKQQQNEKKKNEKKRNNKKPTLHKCIMANTSAIPPTNYNFLAAQQSYKKGQLLTKNI